MSKSQNIYEYKKLKLLENLPHYLDEDISIGSVERILRNKINELVIEYNHLAKDLELYKKAYKRLHHLVQGVTNE